MLETNQLMNSFNYKDFLILKKFLRLIKICGNFKKTRKVDVLILIIC